MPSLPSIIHRNRRNLPPVLDALLYGTVNTNMRVASPNHTVVYLLVQRHGQICSGRPVVFVPHSQGGTLDTVTPSYISLCNKPRGVMPSPVAVLAELFTAFQRVLLGQSRFQRRLLFSHLPITKKALQQNPVVQRSLWKKGNHC